MPATIIGPVKPSRQKTIDSADIREKGYSPYCVGRAVTVGHRAFVIGRDLGQIVRSVDPIHGVVKFYLSFTMVLPFVRTRDA